MIEFVEGVQAEAPAAGENAPEERAAIREEGADTAGRKGEFERLIRGEYKQEFDDRVQRIIDKRFRETKALKEQAAKIKPLMDHLSEKYGENDAEKLYERLTKGAEETDLKTENERLKSEMRMLNREKRAYDTVERWKSEAAELKNLYPAFDMRNEMNSGRFRSLLRAGVDVKTAYEAVHRDELMAQAVRYAAEKTMEKTLNDIRTRGMRPEENGSGAKGASRIAPVSVKNMTRKEREEIEKRCARGEKVYFQ